MSFATVFHSAYSATITFPWGDLFSAVRFLFVFANIFVIAGILYVFFRTKEHAKRYPHPKRGNRPEVFEDPTFAPRWKKLLEDAGSNPPHSYVTGIIAADKFLDEVLKRMGMPGEHMADRLESLGSSGRVSMRALNKVFRAHGVRNQLVHEPDYAISKSDTENVLRAYRDFLKELKLIP